MKLQTPSATATTIDIAHEKAQYDTNAKKLLSNVEFLSRLLQHVVEEFKDMDLEEIKKCIIDPAIGTERIDEHFLSCCKQRYFLLCMHAFLSENKGIFS